MKRYKSIKLNEEIRLSDLLKNQGMSNFTSNFRKERNKIMGAESKTAKLIDVEIDETAGNVTFIWLTTPTDKYPDNYDFGEVDLEGNKHISSNRSKTYELKIRILDFFDWLDTNPDMSIITEKDIKEIFEVSNIKVSSNDPSWHWQGGNYNIGLFDGSIYPTKIPPDHWNKYHNEDQLLSKHLQGLINGIKFWQNPMASMLTKKLKGRGLI